MLKLYNTLSRKKEEFIPIDKENNMVKMYSCGPTVYNFAHIGNMRTYIFMDVLRKIIKYNGFKLLHVMNITDVGHLTSDADEGEDKMLKAARRENKTVYEIAKMYTEVFMNDIHKLNIEDPEYILKATDYIKQMEEYVIKIMENGYAYETSTGIYFDTSKLKTYGELSKVDLDNQKAGARIEVDLEKRNPLDFALWIKAPKEHIMKWDSKWGLCYPGWHIECSAMSKEYLGEVFDIHTGGVDHVPIHHENEIAQSRGATGKNPAKFWMHGEFLLIDNGKMSKSLGNVYTISDLEEKGITALDFRYFTYTSSYRNKLNFTWEAVNAAKTALTRLKELCKTHKDVENKIDEEMLKGYKEKFLEAINDDLNITVAISIVWEIAKEKNKSNDYFELIMKFDEVLSLNLDKLEIKNTNDGIEEVLSDEIKDLVDQRKLARENKDFAMSDKLRDILKEKGYNIIDSKEGQKIEKV